MGKYLLRVINNQKFVENGLGAGKWVGYRVYNDE